MRRLDQLQQRVYDEVKDEPYLAEVPVIMEDGSKLEAIRATLAQSGAVVVILPPLSASVIASGQRNCLLRAAVSIRVMVNPQANADPEEGYAIDALKVVGAVCQAMMTADCDSPDEKFDFAQMPVRLLEGQPGLLEYALAFEVCAELYMDDTETT